MSNSDDKLELFPLIVEQAPDAIIFADVQGVIRVWNNAAMDLFGYRSDEAIGRSLDIIIPAHLRQAHWDGFREAIATGHTKHERRTLKTRAFPKDGRKLYVSL
jgi:PAS domain S-box-containing protein